MSLEVIRQDIVTSIEAAKIGFNQGYTLVIDYENRTQIDTQTQQDPYLAVAIKLIDGQQVDLHTSPIQRYVGQLHLTACVKEGTGSAQANNLLDFFYPKLQGKFLGRVRTHIASPVPMRPNLGWCLYSVIVPFWMDKIW